MKHKKLRIILIVIISLILLLCLVYFLMPKKVAVLGYHSITTENSSDLMRLNIDKFKEQMKYLYDKGYSTLTLKNMKCYMEEKCDIKRKSVLITFDDGYRDNYELVFPILKKYNFNAVVFVIGNNIDKDNYLTKDQIENTKIEYPNIEFASHTYDLHYDNVLSLKYDDYYQDFKKEKELINTKCHAYPYGFYNDDMIKALKDNGYEMAFGFGVDGFRKASNNDNIYNIPRLAINSDMPFWKFKLRLLLPY